jgi:hypothetical protein
LLERKNGILNCYAQDPDYTEIDKLVLKEHGITTLEDPRGFLEIESSTVVISICADVPVKQIVADIARPAIMIWNRVREVDNEPPRYVSYLRFIKLLTYCSTDGDSPRVRQMIRDGYDEYDFFLQDEHQGDIRIYIKRIG